jgi:DNA-directed RNA polymerase subunit K/omega
MFDDYGSEAEVPDSDSDMASDFGEATEQPPAQQFTPQGYSVAYVMPDHLRITQDTLTKYELAKLIGVRAAIIEKTGVHYANNILPSDNLNARNIALIELKQKRMPLVLRRTIG